jgi:cytochrome c oxidase subunit 2
MDKQFQIIPDQASTVAAQVDHLFYFLTAVTAFFTVGIFVVILYFALKYRRRPGIKPVVVETNTTLEITWTAIRWPSASSCSDGQPSCLCRWRRRPRTRWRSTSSASSGCGRRSTPEGAREINTLHLPVGRKGQADDDLAGRDPQLFHPAFRVKQDVVPGRYTQEWFEPSKVGEYHLYCAEYCGAQHSGMIGTVIVMEPANTRPGCSGRSPMCRWRCRASGSSPRSSATPATASAPRPWQASYADA